MQLGNGRVVPERSSGKTLSSVLDPLSQNNTAEDAVEDSPVDLFIRHFQDHDWGNGQGSSQRRRLVFLSPLLNWTLVGVIKFLLLEFQRRAFALVTCEE